MDIIVVFRTTFID